MKPIALGMFQTSSNYLNIPSHSFSVLEGAKYGSFRTVHIALHVSDIILLTVAFLFQ